MSLLKLSPAGIQNGFRWLLQPHMVDTRPQRKTGLSEKETTRRNGAHLNTSQNKVTLLKMHAESVPNDFVWEVSRVEHHAKPPDDKGYDLSTKTWSCLSAPRRCPITWSTTVREAHSWQQMKSKKCEKQNRRRKLDTISSHHLKRNSSQAARTHAAHRNSKGQMVKRRRSITRGFLPKCQPPACQRVPVATKDRSGRTQCQARKTGNIEKTFAEGKHGHKRRT